MKNFFTRNTLSRYLVAGVLFASACCLNVSAQEQIQGTVADGSQYEFDVPASWNGTLVVYAHGIVDPQAPIQLPSENSDFAAFRDALVGRGYAVASSSWSENGYAVKDATQRTHQLKELFTARVSSAQRTLLVGKSLGGLAVLKLAEDYPAQYDGALVMCGPIGGGAAEVKYLADVRILFDHFFPGVLPGDAFHTPTLDFSFGSPTFMAVYGALYGGFFTSDQRTLQFASAAKLPFTNAQEILISGLEGIGFNVRFGNDVLSRTHGHIPYDNTQVTYTGSADDALLNATVERFTSTPDAVNYINKYYQPTGKLSKPVLTLHTLFDPVAPFSQEAAYAQAAAQNGSQNLLVQQSVVRYDHCAFQLQEKMNAFDALAAWSANLSQKPAGGDVTLP